LLSLLPTGLFTAVRSVQRKGDAPRSNHEPLGES
jgi:hypothetical protein